MDAFFVPDGDAFVATEHTRGPWDPGAQHAGPPAALLGRAIEALEPGWQVARITVEILRSIPVATLHVDARVTRPGRRVQFCEATMRAADVEVARASAWRIAIADGLVPTTPDEAPPFAGPEDAVPLPALDVGDRSYFTAMEWRYARGSSVETGPASVWMSPRIPIVAGEEASPLSRVLVAADSGNGVSRELDLATHYFINTELTVHLTRMPEGEWVCLDSVTRMSEAGIGVATTALYDERGRIGAGNQALLIAKR